MSGIPGVFNRDGRPADASVVARMVAAVPHRGPDGARCWASGPVAVGYQRLRLLPEDVPQPIVDPSRDFVIAFDGRLDNRRELIAALASGAAAFRTPSDAELVLAAYGRWGEDCAAHFVGDFAFVIWDGSRRRMFCARDIMGVKPFYYRVDSRSFVWGSDLRQLLASSVAPLEPNEAMIAEYLACAVQCQDETFYRGIMRLPAAHTLTVTADRFVAARYWQIDPVTDLRYASDDEYAEQLSALLREAVAGRARCDRRRLGADLSAGLHSASVVAMARALGRPIETFTILPHGASRAATDPGQSVLDAFSTSGVTAHQIIAPVVDRTLCRASASNRADALDLPSVLASERVWARARDRDVPLLLTGIGGDCGFDDAPVRDADARPRGDRRGLPRQILADLAASYAGRSIWRRLLAGMRTLVPQGWRAAARPVAKRSRSRSYQPDWMGEGLVERVRLDERLTRPAWLDRAPSTERRRICERFLGGSLHLMLEARERAAAEYGIEERHPFLDRRVIEFGVAIADAVRTSDGSSKHFLRHATGRLLPQPVFERDGGGDFTAIRAHGLEALGGAEFFDELRIASLGWINQDRVSAMYRELRRLVENQIDDPERVSQLWAIGGVELWYRSQFVNGARAKLADAQESGTRPHDAASTTDPPTVAPAAGIH